MPDPKNGSGSGEYSALLLAAITEIRDDQREFRTHVNGALSTQGGEIKQILVSLADGTGRMNVMQQTIDTVKSNTDSHDRRLKSMESGSGLRAAVQMATPAPIEEVKPGSGWISVEKIPAIITAIGSLVAVVISSVALLRPGSPPVAVTTNQPTPTTTAPQTP